MEGDGEFGVDDLMKEWGKMFDGEQDYGMGMNYGMN
jgi:hypothetical protein